MDRLEATYRIVTPMFLAGANQDRAELRAPSIKGALRFWYRAIDPQYRAAEARVFGGSGSGEGQAIFLLRVRKVSNGTSWNREDISCFNTMHPDFPNRPSHASNYSKIWQLNGIRYLGFSLLMGANESRKFISAGTVLTFELIFKQKPDEQDRKRILAALWLLGHFGNLGARSRRGFGVLALSALRASETWPEINELQFACNAITPEEWMECYRATLKSFTGWFPGKTRSDHITFANNTRIRLFEPNRMQECGVRQGWEFALDTAGKILQQFRQRWNLKDSGSDYYRVKQHICANDKKAALQAPEVSKQNLENVPKRTSFGLPLQFRFSSLQYEEEKVVNGKITTRHIVPKLLFEGGNKNRQRSASRIFVRVAEIGHTVYPLFIRMDGPLLRQGDEIKAKGKEYSFYLPPADEILDDFWKTIPKLKEFEWSTL